MGKRFMANLHASFNHTWKSGISKISTRCQILGSPFNNFWSWTQKRIQKFFPILGGSIPWNGSIHKSWHFSRFALCVTIGHILTKDQWNEYILVYLHKKHSYSNIREAVSLLYCDECSSLCNLLLVETKPSLLMLDGKNACKHVKDKIQRMIEA